ncbi:MAG: magnesium/cobalt transporter CorA [Actinobacteria bacterium]|nr:magnesium/cobalt transporter CorA [Actinomycetota bacterium]
MGDVLSARVFSLDGERSIDDPDQISDEVANESVLVWVDLFDPTAEDYAWIEREFGLHPLAIDDARRHGQRPKIDIYDTHSFIVAYGALEDHPADLCEVDIFIGQRWLVTVRGANGVHVAWGLDHARDRFRRTRGEHEHRGDAVGFLLYSILDDLVSGYFDALDKTEDDLERLEAMIFTSSGDSQPTVQELLLDLRRKLLEFRRRAVPFRDVVLAILSGEVPWVDDHTRLYFNDLLNHLLRVVDQLDTQRELLSNAVDAQLATQANRMNVIMKKMTSWGAILIGATLVTGVYGMNFKNIPLLDSEYGYVFSVATMLVITIGGYFYFKRKDWL